MADETPQWAKDEAGRILGYADFAHARSYIGITQLNGLAQYVADHSKPPVDQDVLDVRELLEVWFKVEGINGEINPHGAEGARSGKWDDSPDFLAVVTKYREFKARDRINSHLREATQGN
jgi:hypothetical protein